MPDAIETYNDANGDTYIVTANEGAVPMILECSPEACPNGPAEFEETELGEEFMVDGKWPGELPDYFFIMPMQANRQSIDKQRKTRKCAPINGR